MRKPCAKPIALPELLGQWQSLCLAPVQAVVVHEIEESLVPQILECLLEFRDDVVVVRVALCELRFESIDIGSFEEIPNLPSLADFISQLLNPCATSWARHDAIRYTNSSTASMNWWSSPALRPQTNRKETHAATI